MVLLLTDPGPHQLVDILLRKRQPKSPVQGQDILHVLSVVLVPGVGLELVLSRQTANGPTDAPSTRQRRGRVRVTGGPVQAGAVRSDADNVQVNQTALTVGHDEVPVPACRQLSEGGVPQGGDHPKQVRLLHHKIQVSMEPGLLTQQSINSPPSIEPRRLDVGSGQQVPQRQYGLSRHDHPVDATNRLRGLRDRPVTANPPRNRHQRSPSVRYTAAEGLTAQLTIEQGSILDLPAADAAYDVLWCTDVFGIIADLQGAVDECARVFRPNGHLISYITVATDRMAPFRQAELDRSQGCVGSSMNQQNLERCFAERFTIERKTIVGAQHRQSVIEAGDDETLQNLLRASRLMTWPDRYRQTHGDAA